MAPFILKLTVIAVYIAEIFSGFHRKESPSINNGRCGYKFINTFKYITPVNEQIFSKLMYAGQLSEKKTQISNYRKI
jgi:hypothetical protein